MENRLELYDKAKMLNIEQGWGAKAIASYLAIPKDTVCNWLYRGQAPKHLIEPYKEQIKKMYYENRLSAPQIAQRLNFSFHTVYKAMQRWNFKGRNTKQQQLAGARNPNWKGGRIETSDGYIYIYDPEHAKWRGQTKPYLLEHILVWEKTHNKKLPGGWLVHHINGIKGDNRPSNLVALPRCEHNKLPEIIQQRVRELEVENYQLKRALENSQNIHISGN